MTGQPPASQLNRRTVLGAVALTAIGASEAAAQTPIPYQVFGDKIFVPVIVNGEPVEALVDSGSSVTGLDAAFAKSLRIASQGRTRFSGLQGAVSGAWAKDAGISVGGMRLEGARLAVVDYSPMALALQRPVQAVLGRDLFDRFVVQIDADRRLMSLHQRATFSGPAGQRAWPLIPVRGLAAIEIGLGRGRRLRALIDLGNETALIVSPGPAKRLGLLSGRRVSTAYIGGHGPSAVARVAAIETLSIGGLEFHDVPIQVTPRSIGVEANIGMAVLGRFNLWLDFAGRRLWMAPRSGPIVAAPFWKDRTGLSGRLQGGRLVILHVAKGGPAERAGFHQGEQITAINGEPAASANATHDQAPAGTILEFTLADGTRRRLTLADYY